MAVWPHSRRAVGDALDAVRQLAPIPTNHSAGPCNEIKVRSFYGRLATKRSLRGAGSTGDTSVKRLLVLVVGCSLVVTALALTAAPVRAQTSSAVTITFRLAVNGTPAKADSFAVQWGETGLGLCNAPCVGGGHTYTQTMTFPAGVTETFVFIRGSGHVTPAHPAQMFAKQTLTVTSNRAVNAIFTYGTATIATPSTGSALPVAYGGAIAGTGSVLVLLSLWRHRRLRTPH
jgi:hypothetical protein